MRGKRYLYCRKLMRRRNIPAYAGKTRQQLPYLWEPQEHPRVCGENFTKCAPTEPAGGTSPRMRGKRCRTRLGMRRCGNIPAYAGKTAGAVATLHQVEEHPRVCGENTGVCHSPRLRPGTSPRMRGKQVVKDWARAKTRNIPAYAGKTESA